MSWLTILGIPNQWCQFTNKTFNPPSYKGKGSPYSITERRVLELILVLGSQPAGDVTWVINLAVGCHYFPPGPQLPSQPLRGCNQFRCLVNRGTMGVNSLPKTVNRQHRSCDLNPGPSAPESSTLTTRLPSHRQTFIMMTNVATMYNFTNRFATAGGNNKTREVELGWNSKQSHCSLDWLIRCEE